MESMAKLRQNTEETPFNMTECSQDLLKLPSVTWGISPHIEDMNESSEFIKGCEIGSDSPSMALRFKSLWCRFVGFTRSVHYNEHVKRERRRRGYTRFKI